MDKPQNGDLNENSKRTSKNYSVDTNTVHTRKCIFL